MSERSDELRASDSRKLSPKRADCGAGDEYNRGPGYAAFYDGGRSIFDMYEEGTGLAVSVDGVRFDRVSTEKPWLSSPHGNVRYMYGLRVENRLYAYFEYTRADRSHDMRVARLDL